MVSEKNLSKSEKNNMEMLELKITNTGKERSMSGLGSRVEGMEEK